MCYPTLVVRGVIAPGDYDHLLEFAAKNNVDLRTTSIALATPGGDISEALKIGQFLKSIYATVTVGPVTGRCASACFILFISAVDRSATAGTLGIHRPYLSRERFQQLSPSEAERTETNALIAAEEYLHKLRVPSSLVDIMFQHSSSEIHWLNDDELKMLGRRPAWYEEFLIARCSLLKDDEARFLTSNDKALFDKIMAVYNCGKRLTEQEAENNLARAMDGYYKNIPAEEAKRERQANTSHDATYALLTQEVPGWQKINTDKQFLTWLEDAPPDIYGPSTGTLLREAFEGNKRATVVAIFRAYLNEVQESRARAPVKQLPPRATTASGRWVRFAEVSSSSGGLTSHSTWDIDRISLKKDATSFSADVQQTIDQDAILPQMAHIVALDLWTVDCAARSYLDHGGTIAYLDNGHWIPGPNAASSTPKVSASNPRANELINGICTAVYGQ